jgi:hypothetical protein
MRKHTQVRPPSPQGAGSQGREGSATMDVKAAGARGGRSRSTAKLAASLSNLELAEKARAELSETARREASSRGGQKSARIKRAASAILHQLSPSDLDELRSQITAEDALSALGPHLKRVNSRLPPEELPLLLRSLKKRLGIAI